MKTTIYKTIWTVRNFLLEAIEKKEKIFLTYISRPSNSNYFETQKTVTISPRCGIVLQGQLLKDRDFTLETIRIYKKIFPEAEIIVSTWKDEDQELIEKIKKEKVNILLNDKPKYGGGTWQPNVNLQIVSSFSGIKMAKKLGCEYVLKTRTDQRIYNSNTLRLFYNLTEKFPIATSHNQKKRIVGVSLNTFTYRMYGLSDMNVFGSIDDMMLFWGVDLDNRRGYDIKDISLREFAHLQVCEVYFVTEFLKKIGRNLKWTLRDSWEVFAEHLCIVDQQTIGLYWHKYEKHNEYRHPQYYCEKTDKEMNFSEWLEIYSNLQNLKINENILDLRFGEKTSIASL